MAKRFSFGIELRGLDQTAQYLSSFGTRFDKAMRRGIERFVRLVEARAKRKLSGEVLHRRTGRLASSVRGAVVSQPSTLEVLPARFPQQQTGLFQQEVFGVVGSSVIYSRIHEFGGQAGLGHKVTIPPRPYLGPSAEEMTPQGVASIIDEVRKELAR